MHVLLITRTACTISFQSNEATATWMQSLPSILKRGAEDGLNRCALLYFHDWHGTLPSVDWAYKEFPAGVTLLYIATEGGLAIEEALTVLKKVRIKFSILKQLTAFA